MAKADVIKRVRTANATQREHLWLYNLDNNRPDEPVGNEIRAFLSTKPMALMLVESIGNKLPKVNGYHRHADRSNDSRANLACYVRDIYARPDAEQWRMVPGA